MPGAVSTGHDRVLCLEDDGSFAAFLEVDQRLHREIARILTTLEERGVLRSRHLAYAALRLLFRGRSLKAGEYRFEGARSTEEVLRTLVEGKVVTHRVTIPEGLTAGEVFDLLARERLATLDELRSLFARPAEFAGVPAGAPTLEGFLGPDTYLFTRSVGARGIVSELVQTFRRSLPERFDERARALGRTPLEAVTLASLVEKGLVREVGRDKNAGNAILYGTTRTFLEKFGLKDLSELPPLDEFAPDVDTEKSIRDRLSSGGSPDSMADAAEDDLETID